MQIASPKSPNTSVPANDLALRRFGYSVLLVLFGFGGFWAVTAPIESAALALGVVQVEGKRKPIQHLEGGLVSEIFVANGDWVTEDEKLLVLDAAKDRAEKDILMGRVLNSQARVDRLRSERDELQKVVFSDALLEKEKIDARAENAIASEMALFDARLSDRRGEEAVITSQIKGFVSQLESKRTIIESLDSEINDLEDLLDDGYIDKQRLRELRRTRSQAIGDVSELDVLVEESRLKILQLHKRFKNSVVDELTAAQEELYDQRQQYSAVSDRVRRATISAPVAGRVLNLDVNTVGAVISPGDTILEIVPEAEQLIVDAQVSPMDIDRIQLGQEAEVRFSVFKDAYLITGTLINLSADRVLDEGSEFPYYAAEIRLNQSDLSLLGDVKLVPGMPAEVIIKTGERTMMGYLLSPMNRLFSRSLRED